MKGCGEAHSVVASPSMSTPQTRQLRRSTQLPRSTNPVRETGAQGRISCSPWSVQFCTTSKTHWTRRTSGNTGTPRVSPATP